MDAARERNYFAIFGWIVSSHIPGVALLNIVRPYMKITKIINPSPALSFELLSLLLKTLKQFKNIFFNLDWFSLLFFIKALLIFNEKKRKKWKICVYEVSDQPWILIPHLFYTVICQTEKGC